MKPKIRMYCKSFCVSWLMSIDFCREPNSAGKIEDLLHADRKMGAKSLADGC